MKTLFDATHIGPMTLKNRLWRSATWMNMADEKGHLTDRLERVYLDLARGGVGTIVTGYAFVLEEEQPNPGMLGIYDDSFVPEYRRLTQKIRNEGANMILQIAYGGSATSFQPENRLIWGPSAVPHPLFKVVPTEISKINITTVVSAFAKAAARAKAAGFDGVQIHGAHTYFLSQFLSPYFNRRRDSYGGPIGNRARIIFETLAAIRREVGTDYPVFIKMHCSDEWDDNGLTEEESLFVAKELERMGISGIEFSGGNLDVANHPNAGPIRSKILKPEKQSHFAETTKRIAEHLTVPVISVGGHRDAKALDTILNSSAIGYFSLSRPLLAEPGLVNRWQSGNLKKSRCIACNKCFAKDGNRCFVKKKTS